MTSTQYKSSLLHIDRLFDENWHLHTRWQTCNIGQNHLMILYLEKMAKLLFFILIFYPMDSHLLPLRFTPASRLEIYIPLEKRTNVAFFGLRMIITLIFNEKLKAPTIYITVQSCKNEGTHY